MAKLKVNQGRVTKEAAEQLEELCPFGAISEEDGKLSVSSGWRMCRLCVKKGPAGVMEWVEEEPAEPMVKKEEWKGIAVYVQMDGNRIHPVTLELIGKAKELASVIQAPVYCLLIGSRVKEKAEELQYYGIERVFLYDHPGLADFNIMTYANVFSDFIENVRPSSILVGATSEGRSLAPRVAARFRTGLTADCTVLEMKDNSDLVQIRPAFGGNIMAQIVTPRHRPQFCTVRYKVFSQAERNRFPGGSIEQMEVKERFFDSSVQVLSNEEKTRQADISDAEIIVAVGRGVKSRADVELVKVFADRIGAQMAGTRPLIENGWFDARQQIGLSGRTVKPKLIVTIGISGAVQFAAGMKGADCIIAINKDKKAPIFDIANYGLVGDWYEILPELVNWMKEGA